MKQITAALVVGFILLGVMGTNAQDAKIKVVATLQIFSTIAKEIGGNLVDADYIVPPGADIHDYSLTQNDAEKIKSADLIILASSKFFSIDSKIKDLVSDKRILDFDDYNATVFPLGDIKENIHGYWLYPKNGINIGYAIFKKLSSMIPQSTPYFEKNYLAYRERVENAEKIIGRLSRIGDMRNKTALLAVPGVYYPVKSMHIRVYGSIVEGPNRFISPQEITHIEDEIKRGRINFIVNAYGLENSRAGEIAKEISRTTGIDVLYVDIFSGANYTDILIKNAAILSSEEYVQTYSSQVCNYTPFIYSLIIMTAIAVITGFFAYRYRHELMK